MKKGKVLFLCTHNSARSQIAEAFAKNIAGKEVHISSAGTVATEIHPMAKTVLDELGIDYKGRHSKTIDELDQKDFNLVITLCDNARESCPVFPGAPAMVHWSLEDPASFTGTEKKKKQKFMDTALEIKGLVSDLFNRGYFAAFLNMGQIRENIVNSLNEGILAHDLNRKIFFFSEGAERITGIKKDEIIGKDCHEIFAPHLCSENCSFCDGDKTDDFNRKQYSSVMLNKHGERKDLEVSVAQLKNETGKIIGVVASFTDHTDLKNLVRELKEEHGFRGIIGQDFKMQRLYELIRDLAQCDFPVVLSGESGTGKEIVARAIHDESPRKDNLFVPINCGALPEGTLESELFGHVKGAFTGAIRDKKGRFELADGGTIFLDEVGELSQAIQVKLLRVLQENTFEPVGSEKTKKVDVRIISASNKNLRDLVKKEKFRDDLFYRLSVVPVELPPLRERRNDIPILAGHFLDQVLKKIGRESLQLSDEVLSIMMSYSWPGNVRQLQNAIQFITIKCHDSVVLPEHLPPEIMESASSYPTHQYTSEEPGKVGRKPKLNKDVVIQTLQKTGGNKAKAARILGVGRATLYNFLKDNPQVSI
jgi:PAS domain S-box-containing protein